MADYDWTKNIVGEDEHTYTALDPTGETVRIAKAGVSSERQAKIKSQLQAVAKSDDRAMGLADSAANTGADFVRDLATAGVVGVPTLLADRYAQGNVKAALSDAADKAGPAAKKAMGAISKVAGMGGLGDAINQAKTALLPNLFPAQPAATTQPPATQGVPEMLARPDAGGPAGALAQAAMGAALPARPEGVPIPVRPSGGGGGGGGGYDALLNKGAADQIAGIKQYADAGAQRAAEEAGYKQEAVAQARAMEVKRQEFEVRAAQERDNALKRVQEATDQLKSISTRVDPKHFWADKTTGDKVVAAIGVFLGGLGGGDNRALGILNNAIDRDIQAQQANIQNAMEKGKANLSAANNLYGLYLQKIGDDRAALLASKDSMLEMSKMQLDALASKYAGPEMQAKAQQAVGVIEQERAKTRAELSIRAQQLGIQRAELGLRAQELGIKAAKGGERVPASEASKIGQANASIATVNDLERQWKDKIGPLSAFTQHLPMTDASKFKDARDLATQIIGGALEGGKLSDNDKAFYRSLMPDPGDSDATAMAKLNNIRQRLISSRDEAMRALQGAGYNTGSLQPTAPISSFKAD